MRTLNIHIPIWCPAERPARVGFLETTLRTLFARHDEQPDLSAAVHLVDNGSCPEALAVVEQYQHRCAAVVRWPTNRGINAAYEALMNLAEPAEFTMALDCDMELFDRLSCYVQLLRERQEIGAAGGQDSPEHRTIDVIRAAGRGWMVKVFERGSFLMFRTAELEEMRPFPIDQKANWDWHICQWGPRSLEKTGKRVAVLPGGARHLGWRRDDGTWMDKYHCEWPGMFSDLPDEDRPASEVRAQTYESIETAYARVLRDAHDIREHLPTLVDLATGLESATTLGHDVSTAIAFLKAGVPHVRNYHHDDRTRVAVRTIQHTSKFQCFVCNVLKRTVLPTDLLAIDSIHTYDQLRAELNLHADCVGKFITLHDTTLYGDRGEDGGRGMKPSIAEFLAAHPEWSLRSQFDNNNGLTVLARTAREIHP